jgi:hypothetical protein
MTDRAAGIGAPSDPGTLKVCAHGFKEMREAATLWEAITAATTGNPGLRAMRKDRPMGRSR